MANYTSGFKFTVQEVDKEDLEDTLLAANTDSSISGVLVYYPIFSSGQDAYLQQLVSLDKDVEGLSHRYLFNMYQNIRFLDAPANQKKSILPCTPLAVIKILEYLQVYNSILPYGDRLFGKTIAVINRSEVVGRPMAALLANDGATVYSIDVAGVQKFSRGSGIRKRKHEVKEVDGKTLADVLPSCDVVISGVPGDKFKVPLEHLKDGVVCINFSSDKVSYPTVVDSGAKLDVELRSGSQAKGIDLRTRHRKGHHCDPPAQSASKEILIFSANANSFKRLVHNQSVK